MNVAVVPGYILTRGGSTYWDPSYWRVVGPQARVKHREGIKMGFHSRNARNRFLKRCSSSLKFINNNYVPNCIIWTHYPQLLCLPIHSLNILTSKEPHLTGINVYNTISPILCVCYKIYLTLNS